MASFNLSLKCGVSLTEIIAVRWKQLGYRSASAYMKGLARYDAMVLGEHAVTLPLSNLPDDEQERIDRQLLDVVKLGVGQRGQLLRRLIDLARTSEGDSSGPAIAATVRKRAAKKP